MEIDLDGGQQNVACHTVEEDTTATELFNLVLASFLPKQNPSLDQPLGADTFKNHVKNCEANLKMAVSVLENQSDCTGLNKQLVICVVLLCGEHSKNELWTSPQTVACAKKLLGLVLARCKCISVVDLLLHYKIDTILSELRPKLLENTWKNNPAACSCFIWILFQIKCPDLGDVLHSVLPTCLLLIDDHVYSNKLKGLQCIEHVAKNVSRAELNQYGRGSVIYNALEHMVYLREPEIIPPLASCLTALLSKTEHRCTPDTLSWSHFDDVLNIWLSSMEMEQNLLLQGAYTESLNQLIPAMGLASVRWSKQILSILSEYCEQDHTRDKALLNLLTFIKTTWPRLSSNFQPIVVILMKVVIRLSKSSTSKNTLPCTKKKIKQCFSQLELLCNKEYYSFENEMKNCSHTRDCFLMITDSWREDS